MAKDLEEALTNIETKLGGTQQPYMDLGGHLEYIESLLSGGNPGGGSGSSLPTPPAEDGKYFLTVTVLNGNVTYAWELDQEDDVLEAQQY